MARQLQNELTIYIRTRNVWNEQTGQFDEVIYIEASGVINNPDATDDFDKAGGFTSVTIPYDGRRTLDEFMNDVRTALKAKGGF